MFEHIEQLITDKRFPEALNLIKEELKNRFDFADEIQKRDFDRLQDLYDNLENSVGEEVCTEINLMETKRSIKQQKQRMDLSYTNLRNHSSLPDALSRLMAMRSPILYSDGYDAYIYILDLNHLPQEVISNCTYPAADNLMKLQTGQSFDTETIEGRKCFSIIGHSDSNDSNPLLIIDGLKEAIDSVYKEKAGRVSVVFACDNKSGMDEVKICFFIILVTFLAKIIYNDQMNNTPEFYFLFKEDTQKNLFDRTTVQFKKRDEEIKTIQTSDKERRLKDFVEKCSTCDEAYIEMLRSVFRIIDEEDVPILLLGESGVGKSYLAKIIHESSIRGNKGFEGLNCGELSGERLDQKLWGWTKGSFTDGVKDYEGKVKPVEGGTLFLDEIDRTSPELRNGLLTFIETKEYTPLGEKTTTADVRLIFGSNKDLRDYVRKGLFEQDFYNRISGRIIQIPPLRDRKDDIDLFITYTLDKLAEKKKRAISIGRKERDYIKSYAWPGNARELNEYIKQRYYDALADDQDNISLEQIKNSPFEKSVVSTLDDYEKMISSLKKHLEEWDSSKGAFLHEIIFPVLAKLYLDDCFKHMNKTDKWEKATEILGLSGKRYNDSSLAKARDKFDDVKNKLGL